MNNIYEKALSVASKLTVKSALNPALWFAGVITPLCLIAAFAFRNIEIIRNVLIFAALIPIFLVSFAYLFFMFNDRDRLHSEEFQLKKMEIVKSKYKGEIPGGESLPSITVKMIEKKNKNE